MSIQDIDYSSSVSRTNYLLQSAQAPIFILGRDLLWQIFFLNVDMEEKSEDDLPAITTLRHTSQVCWAWRDLTVTSPSLWGRAINFDRLQQENWRNEVMDRTGEYRLFIRGVSYRWRGAHGSFESIIIGTLADNWARIRSLNIDFGREYRGDLERDFGLWSLLKRPAPIMESFQLSLQGFTSIRPGVEAILSPLEFSIFESQAPALRVFISRHIRFSLQAPWMSHICRLALNTRITVKELLDALTSMPLLETLEDEDSNAISDGDLRSIRKITLNNLRQISISTTRRIDPCLTFLANIEPVEGRSLNFTGRPSQKECDPNAQEMYAASNTVSSYSRQAGLKASTEIRLYLLRHQFRFETYTPEGRSFSFDLDCVADFLANTMEELFTALNHSKFPYLQTLTLRLECDQIHPTSEITGQFIASVSSVEFLETTLITLDFLLRLPDEFKMKAFPVVRDIAIKHPQPESLQSVKSFLSFRRDLGRPISRLYVRMEYGKLDIRTLEQISGLKIVFQFFSGDGDYTYICGSGRPELLLIE